MKFSLTEYVLMICLAFVAVCGVISIYERQPNMTIRTIIEPTITEPIADGPYISSVGIGYHQKSFLDLQSCFEGKAKKESYNILIGSNIIIDSSQNCDILIGDNVKAPPKTSYFFNIGNKICGDLRTKKRLPCPK